MPDNDPRPKRWDGGRVRYDRRGRPVYVIERRVAGHRYVISTRARGIRAALEHLARFEANPEAYDPRGDVGPAPLWLDAELVEAFLAWSRAPREAGGKGNTRQWVGKQKALLAWWAERLHGVDLRRASLTEHVLPHLEGVPGRGHRIRVIKAFYGWLRKVSHRLAAGEDPTFGTLPAPQGRPAQLRRSKVVHRDHVLLVLQELLVPWRDALELQAATGWHTTEIVRFARDGALEALPRAARGDDEAAGVAVCPLTKGGEPLRTRLAAAPLEAARRLLAHGPISREWYDRAVKAACAVVKRPDGKVGIPAFTPGRMRHSVATWAIDSGADPAMVAAFLGHKSPRTTRKFYATHATPARVPTLS